jgi:hypothetical protein
VEFRQAVAETGPFDRRCLSIFQRPFAPKGFARSSCPLRTLRLLPAGATVAGWVILLPLELRALFTAHTKTYAKPESRFRQQRKTDLSYRRHIKVATRENVERLDAAASGRGSLLFIHFVACCTRYCSTLGDNNLYDRFDFEMGNYDRRNFRPIWRRRSLAYVLVPMIGQPHQRQ